MQLTQQESSAAFWAGAKKGAIRSLGYVAVAAVAVGLLMLTPWIPAGAISIGAALLTAVSTVLTIGMFSGHNALAQYHQQKHNQVYEAKLAQLEGRVPAIETPQEHIVHSPKVSTIIENGSRVKNFAATAEEERAAAIEGQTIH